jgi:aerobic carbon-monoxide dehydrogenase medium subunit
MRRFEYHEPRSLAEASRLLVELGEGAHAFAGGTDLLVEIREGLRRCAHVINLKRVEDLKGLIFDPARGLRIGALATARQIETDPVIARHYPNLLSAVRSLGSIQVRNRATLVGNICRASPSADTAPPLIADEATVTIAGPTGVRKTPISQFFLGPGKTVLARGDIVVAVETPPDPSPFGRAYLKLGRRQAMELATVGVAATLHMEGDSCVDSRIALGAVAPKPVRAASAERALCGRLLTDAALDEASRAAMAECAPIDNVRASAAYRRDMVGVLTRRAILAAWEMLR